MWKSAYAAFTMDFAAAAAGAAISLKTVAANIRFADPQKAALLPDWELFRRITIIYFVAF